ncbi:hypothetical protein ACVWU4_000932 [Campylobacter coli]
MAKQNRSAQVFTAAAEKPANPVITSSNHKCPPAGTVNITVQEVEGVTFTASVKESDKGSVQVNGTTITYTAHSPAATDTANVVVKATKDGQESEAVEVPVEVVVSYITLNPNTITVEKGKQATATITTNVASISRHSADQSKVTSTGDKTQITVTGVEVSEGAVNVTLTGTADGGSEVSVQLPVTVTAPAVVTPDAPVLTEPGDKEVNESTELVIAFNNVDGATLNAEVVGGAENGTANVEGFNVKYQAPAVDADKDVVVNVTVSKDGQTSTATAVNVKVKNVPNETQLEVSVNKDPIIVGDKVVVTINTNAADYTVNEINQDVATFDKATKTITCHKEGAARFVFRATAQGLGEKTAELNIVVKQYVFLEVIPSSVTVRQNEESIDLLINTNGDVVNAVVTNEGVATYNRETKKVTGVTVGSTEITFTASKAGKVDRVVTVPVTVEEEVIYIPKLLTTNTSVVSGDTLDLRFATPQKGATLSARVENEEAGTVRVDGDTVYFESKQLDESKLALVYVKTVKDTKESAEISVPVLVTVRPKTKITIEGPSSLKIGDKYDYKVVTEASSFVIESSDPAIAAVEGDFVVPKAVGKVTITAKATAANKLEGTASIEATVTEKVKGTTPKLLTDQSRLTTERAKELVLEFQLVNGETLQGKVDPALGAINVVNNTASVYLLPDVVSDTVQMSFTSLSKDNVASDALDVTINVNKLKDLNPVPVKPVATKIKIEENMSYVVLMDTALAGIKYKLFANPTSIVDVNTQTMTIIGANKGEGHITVVASSIGYDNNVINIPITVTEDPDEELPDIPENPDEPGKEEMTEQEISDLLLQKGVPVREKFDTIKKKGPAAFQAIVNKLDSYNEQMNPATSSLDSKQCANKNFELYTMIKNATNVSDNSSFNLRFDIINLYFKEYKDEAFDEFALFRADDAWTWGQNSLETYQNLITIITSLCDITTRANNIRTIDVPKTINDVNSDLTQLSKQNIIGYYSE